MKGIGSLTFVVILLAVRADKHDVEVVSYGSAIKLQHVQTGYRMHSHDLKYGQGSGQQSVTGLPLAHDPNSLWLVKPAHGSFMPPQGSPVLCGATIRLEHVNTGANLHTHKILAGLSRKWEVSAFGFREENGDSGDNFVVICEGKKTGEWLRYEPVNFKHVDTGFFVSMSEKFKYGQPVSGHLEVYSTEKTSKATQWKTNEGFYFVQSK
mmetsp:Transcript_11864/g.36174  ORF Transcript_11864/g.36174 Transcript_11864/m.36174 type:complete len:209 (+) Transcript_11864:67-693(+)|eukprot:CAMPEP_0198736196 /NCGR_PEP_ID=MMETSP1475-20131203/64112_1 /TAXON_ID= ORGANISM="Unidentified sp., Strain CCMP1999" /NCGR_SAMPLE_ID=MMETSP1475 /ASSEMBLY_ACC=CAM_ASM_001111 /LENGTH=208 /DNA_ID=CAMNT_0044499969 /DNA_START=19 /DNA_END=645 /DNA_ORIENTATION=+